MKYKKELDDKHIRFNYLDSFNKPNNAVISPRSDGKTTRFLILKAAPNFEEGHATAIQFRNIADMTPAAIESYSSTLADFCEGDWRIKYSGIELKTGICPIYCRKRLLFLAIALSIPKRRLKGLVFPEVNLWLDDEFIVDTHHGEKYLPGEYDKFQTAIDTLRKRGEVKSYHLGNPYSLVNPYTLATGLDIPSLPFNKVKASGTWAVWRRTLSPDLRAEILATNSTYGEVDDYTRMALDGIAVNDAGRRYGPMPPRATLRFCFRWSGRWFGIWINERYFAEDEPSYWVGMTDRVGSRRASFVFDLSELMTGSTLFGKEERSVFSHVKMAFKGNEIGYQDEVAFEAMVSFYEFL